MLIEQTVRVALPVRELWEFLVDVPAVSRCVPGLEGFSEIAGDEYAGVVRVRLGPISLALKGRLSVAARNIECWSTQMRAEGSDSRISGGVTADVTVHLVAEQEQQTSLNVVTRAVVLGKLGEFGQPLIKRTANKILDQFVTNLVQAVASRSDEGKN